MLRGDPHPHHASHSSTRMDSLSESAHSSNHDLPHVHRSSWFVNCSRAEAIERLKHCKDGTFLIRPGSQDNPYSLSIAWVLLFLCVYGHMTHLISYARLWAGFCWLMYNQNLLVNQDIWSLDRENLNISGSGTITASHCRAFLNQWWF